ncbi:unnamed protein product [Paramecium primaurelia]|uniref:Actin n=1 Tax=Paramecium primaurelia TaxID=5886 RepID=A0A8S1MPT9_PARPR|nr:unnamed protein product [Paramecium primaurelia]
MKINKRATMESEYDQKDIVVIDNGTDTIKVGISGEDYPRLIYDNKCGSHSVQNDNDNPNNKPQLLFGQDLKKVVKEKKLNVQLSNPIKDGKIDNVESMKEFWQYILEDGLQISELQQVNLLIIDQVKNSKEYKSKLAEVFFDYLKVQSVLFMNSASLSLFSTGLVSGLSIELGHAVNTVVPIYQGFPIMHALEFSHISGAEITQCLENDLKAYELLLDKFSEEEKLWIIKDIKEKMCYIASDYEMQINSEDNFTEEERSYELPDEQVIHITPQIRYHCSEALFNSAIVNKNSFSLPQMIVNSILRCDKELRQELVSNMVLGGGTSMFQGLISRLQDDICQIYPGGAMRSEFNFVADFQRKYSAWIGGSMLGSLKTFQSLAINKQEYEENPEGKMSLIHKRTF